jgi:hypothetical protein
MAGQIYPMTSVFVSIRKLYSKNLNFESNWNISSQTFDVTQRQIDFYYSREREKRENDWVGNGGRTNLSNDISLYQEENYIEII